VIVTSFSPATLRAFRRLSRGKARTGAHPLEIAAYLALPHAGLARVLTRGRPVALQVPHRRGPLTVASRGLIRRAHANGLQVHVWTIDDPAEMRELLDRGVDGIMTDRTDLLKVVLDERGQWREQP
jgi:glycerophosphoryl diester phosphodiesterase